MRPDEIKPSITSGGMSIVNCSTPARRRARSRRFRSVAVTHPPHVLFQIREHLHFLDRERLLQGAVMTEKGHARYGRAA